MSKENTDLYGDKIEKSTYTPTAEEIKKKEKQDKINQDLMIRKLKSEPKVEEVLKLKTNISPVETRLLTNLVEVTKPDYKKNDKVVTKVRLNNVQTYFKQINHNLIIGAKALYLVCRDLNTARHDLGAEDFKVLSDALPLSDATISKYTKIAQSDVCKKLYIKGNLPEGWTTMYEIAKVEETKVKEKLEKNVTSTSTLDQIFKIIGKVFKKAPVMFEYDLSKPKEFLKVAFESGKDEDGFDKKIGQVDPIALLLVKEKVEKAVQDAMQEYQDKYPSDYGIDNDVAEVKVSFHKEIVDQTTKSLRSFFNKDKKVGWKNTFEFKLAELTNTLKSTVLG